mmetsp:Transcript_25804/g.89855  ORF Transcript_25804/g.89855 Transcript_25804/m.89855 type:complete len:327 (-) Transcript_25804:32-1012(-)
MPSLPSRIGSSFSAGLQHALSAHNAILLLFYSRTVRIRCLQCAVLNGVIFLGSIFFTNVALFPLLGYIAATLGVDGDGDSAGVEVRKAVDGIVSVMFSAFWFTPLYIISFALSSHWYQGIAVSAFQHWSSEGRFTPERQPHAAPSKAIKDMVAEEAFRLVVVVLMLLFTSVVYFVPWIGPLVSFCLCCFIYPFQIWAYKWAMQGVDWSAQVAMLERHWPYFFGFGLPCTLLTFFYSTFVAAGMYALVFPLYIVLAIASTPPRVGFIPPLPLMGASRFAVNVGLAACARARRRGGGVSGGGRSNLNRDAAAFGRGAPPTPPRAAPGR